MLNNYVSNIDEIKKGLHDEGELENEDYFRLGEDFMRFKFRTDDNLVYNQKVNIPVCSLSSVINRGKIFYLQFKLQESL